TPITQTTLTTHPTTPQQLTTTLHNLTNTNDNSTNSTPLLQLSWNELAATATPEDHPASWTLLGTDHLGLAPALAAARTGTAPAVTVAQLAAAPDISWPHAVREASRAALDLVQAWLADPAADADRLVVVTSGAVEPAENEHLAAPALAAVWGLLRSAQAENPDRITLLDLDDPAASHDVLTTAVATALTQGEAQLALRKGTVFVPRLVRAAAPLPEPADAPSWRLDVTEAGTLDNVALLPTEAVGAEALPSGHVRVAIHAAGLNFRDSLIALGLYPDDDAPFGSEAAGTITHTAEDVTHLKPGDRVYGLFPGAITPATVTDARYLARTPSHFTHTEAATTPVVYLTAYHALKHLADLQPHHHLLIHAATGGVGLAALNIARHIGATVHTTTSVHKQHHLTARGIPTTHISNSRDLSFEEHINSTTDGQGIDFALHSLTHDYTDATLRLLEPRKGHLIDIGKLDIRDADTVGRDHPGVGYTHFDMHATGADHIQGMLQDLTELFENGDLEALPTLSQSVGYAPGVLRHLAAGQHIGKLALTVPQPLDPNGTVLITGATGTLGAHVARHLATQHHANRFLLLSRSGTNAPGADQLLTELRELGAHADLLATDTADHHALTEALATIPTDHPLTGVFHVAGVLRDATVPSLSHAHLDSVLGPKTDAAWNLHELTKHLDLAAFVLFSSAAGTLGTPGQANYAAANAALDALAHHRHTHGLPATSIAWGLWAEASTLTTNLQTADRTRMSRSGVLPLSTEEGLALLDAALSNHQPVLTALHLDDSALQDGGTAVPPLLQGVLRAPRRRAAAATAGSAQAAGPGLAERLTGLTAADQQRLVLDLVRGEAATVLAHPDPDRLAPDQPFKDLGFDSLTAVELRNRLRTATGLHLPTTLVFDHPTPLALAGAVLADLAPEPASANVAVLTEIGRLEELLHEFAGGSGQDENGDGGGADDRNEVTARLRALLRGWDDGQQAHGPDEDTVDLDSADDDELFSALERELGSD
ncbi:SDR family NAD(P)-dependent oxidoreductase, partial [Kitasatospora sp. NPDC057223]|uniref:SDR family NAD(P)-dependent oxidoreductase n=1 Tax=Kitasatospora sp. NPDC057223 TaxID=3346055 RepID=UPI003629BB11